MLCSVEFLKAVDDAVAKGIKINRKLAHSVITGPTGSGKSSLVRRLLSLPFNKFSKSTGVAEGIMTIQMGELNPTTFHSATAVGSDAWEELQYEVSLLNQMGQRSPPVPADTQPSADPTPSASAEAEPAAEDVKPKPRGRKGFKFLQFFTRKGKSGKEATSWPLFKQETVSVVAVSSERIIPVIKKYGFDAVMKYFKQTSTLYLRDTGGQVEFQEMLPLLIYGPSIFFFRLQSRSGLPEQAELQVPGERRRVSQLLHLLHHHRGGPAPVPGQRVRHGYLGEGRHQDAQVSRVDRGHAHRSARLLSRGDHPPAEPAHPFSDHGEWISVIWFSTLIRVTGSVMFAVDNSSESDEGFRAIRSQVNSLVSRREEFAIDYPIQYLLFCLDLQDVKKTILSLDEFKALAAKYNIVGEQIFPLLQFLHLRVGVIRYFDVDGLRDIVVLEPQVLFNSVTALIVKNLLLRGPCTTREAMEYKEKGMLAASTFECVLDSSPSMPHAHSPHHLSSSPVADLSPSRHSERSEEVKRGILPASAFQTIHVDDHLSPKKFLQLLVQLRIIAAVRTAGDQEEKYFIPCVLNHVPESSPGDRPHTDVLPLAVRFQCQHCPKGVFGVLVTHLMAPEPSRSSHDITTTFTLLQDKIFKDQVFFAVRCTGLLGT